MISNKKVFNLRTTMKSNGRLIISYMLMLYSAFSNCMHLGVSNLNNCGKANIIVKKEKILIVIIRV